MCNKINACNAEKIDDNDEDAKKERDNKLDNTVKYYRYYLAKATISEDTMYAIIFHMLKNSRTDIQARLLNELFNNNPDVFLSIFIKK
jgi:hypothetical protein